MFIVKSDDLDLSAQNDPLARITRISVIHNLRTVPVSDLSPTQTGKRYHANMISHGYYESLKKPIRNHMPLYEPSKNSFISFSDKESHPSRGRPSLQDEPAPPGTTFPPTSADNTGVSALKIQRYGFQQPTRLCFYRIYITVFSVPDPTYSLSKESPTNLFHRIYQVCTMYFSRPISG